MPVGRRPSAGVGAHESGVGVVMIRFTLPIIPTAQQRARHTRTGRAYKSTDQEANERTFEAMLMPYVPEKPLSGPVKVLFTAYMPIPASTTKRAREAMQREETPHTKKPDLDNLEKQLLDCMTRMRFWEDDRQVYMVAKKKIYSPSPRWEVAVG